MSSRRRKKYRGNRISIIIMIIAFGVAGFAAYKLLSIWNEYSTAKSLYLELQEEYVEANIDTSDDMWWQTDVTIDFLALKQKYPDCVAWIRFDNPDIININYPVMWDGTNTTYLRADPDGNYLTSGTLFIDGKNNSDMQDYHTLIYGHNMKNTTMFGMLAHFSTEEDFYEQNKYFTIYTESMIYRYQIYSYHYTDYDGYVYRVGFAPNYEFEEFISETVADSERDTGLVPEVEDRIVTLSTCASNNDELRFVVHGVCIDECTNLTGGTSVTVD